MTEVSQSEIAAFLTSAHEMSDISAKVILPYFRQEISVFHKDGKGIYDPVTDADRKSEQVIREYIAQKWPDHSIIGEEYGSQITDSDFCWIVDPIDGTRAFVMGSPLWGTLIGLSHGETQILGMMNQPFTNERFWATADGAFARFGNQERRLKVSACSSLSEAIITTTCPDLFANERDKAQFEKLRQRCQMTRYGGDCYSYCLLALGHIDLIVETGLASYDIAPLIPLVEQAGGVISTWDGSSARAGGQIVAAASKVLHEQALEILAG